jgi:hypothetical protein
MLLVVISTAGTALAAETNAYLRDYSAIKEALISGYPVSVVTDFSKCKDAPQNSAIGGTSINSFLVITDPKTKSEHIAFSDYHQRLNDADATPLVEFIRYTITTDNNVAVMMSSSPTTTGASPRSYTCPIDTGSKFFKH